MKYTPTRRRGSVLILVVALLVILALMGTAYLATAQLDRMQTRGTGGGMLIDGSNAIAPEKLDKAILVALDAAESELRRDVLWKLNGNNWYRPPQSWGNNTVTFNYDHWDAGDQSLIFPAGDNNLTASPRNDVDQRVDAFMAARLPEYLDINGTKVYCWPYISGWPTELDGTSPVRFESPYTADASGNYYNDPLGGHFRQRSMEFDNSGTLTGVVQIGSVAIKYPANFTRPSTLAERTRLHPAFIIRHPQTGQPTIYLAGDADGDGIADSALVRLQSVQFLADTVPHLIDGPQPVSWYIAVRIVDNNSAINVNTARSVEADRSFTDPIFNTNLGLFRANIGLYELLDTTLPLPNYAQSYRERDTFEMYRHGGQPNVNPLPISRIPVQDDQAARNDAEYLSEGDALEQQLARRTTAPGFNIDNNALVNYRAFGQTDLSANAYRFVMVDRNGDRSTLEQTLFNSLARYSSNLAPNDSNKSFPYYPANLYDLWYHQNFDFTSTRGSAVGSYPWNAVGQPGRPAYQVSPTPPLRSLLTTYNPTSNSVPMPDMAALKRDYASVVATGVADPRNIAADLRMPDWTVVPAPAGTPDRNSKASVNTATFGELWRAYWAVMTEQRTDGTLSIPANTQDRMFRSAMRESQGGWSNYEQLLLRAALAAVNTMDLRNPDVDGQNRPLNPTMRRLNIGGKTVTVFGTRPQPYITEIYANNNNVTERDGGTNKQGYVAIELCNPFPQDINLQGWQLWAIDRSQNPMTVTRLHTFSGAGAFVPAATDTQNGFAVIHNIAGGANDAKFRPGKAVLKAGVNPIPVSGLSAILGWNGTNSIPNSVSELVLMRPASEYPLASSNTQQPDDYAPVDSFDFRGFDPSPNADDPAAPTYYDCTAWHYARIGDATAGGGKHWHFVYPGPYTDASQTPGQDTPRHRIQRARSASLGAGANHFRVPLANPTEDDEEWQTGTQKPPINLGGEENDATYVPTFPIQLANVDWAGGNKVGRNTTGGKQRFPFGGFARNGDILKVPYIGSYRVGPAAQGQVPATLEEMNAVTMDSFYAEHRQLQGIASGGELPEIGRFCPDPFGPDFDPRNTQRPQYAVAYDWATDIFDYLTVQCPKDDFTPNFDPRFSTMAGGGYTASPVANAGGQANVDEDQVGLQGLVNINTAPVEVLAMLPLVMRSNGTVDRVASYDFALAIVDHRRRYGPFKSLFDLNKVTKGSGVTDRYRYAGGLDSIANKDPGYQYGDISPMVPDKTDKVSNDFEYKYAQITRLSNLVTTRSDTYTVYILVQAWQNAGTQYPVLLAERRAAYVIDRTKLSQRQLTILEKIGVSTK